MHVFTIRDIENLTGIKAHTLRIWEQRYQLMVPERETGQHRTYSNEDLKQLLKISTLYHNGYKISKIAALTKDQVNKLALDTLVIKDPHELYVSQLVEAAIDFDEARFDQIMNTCIQHYGFERSVFKIFFPFLNKIGLLWMTGHVVPAMEHFSSGLIRKKMTVALDGLKQPAPGANMHVLLFTPEYERHELPLLMMQYILKKNNVRCVLFGQHVSLEMLDEYCKANPVTHLYAHIITFLHRYDIGEYVAALSLKFRDKHIVLSGHIVQSLQRSFVNVRVLKEEEMGSWFAPH
ncbi:MAG TPA: MerR family transcriptional regulator [Chitinophagaceae bacterium]|nr:MerR family transcriptional regulator [Chitinophagaceae bacterium]